MSRWKHACDKRVCMALDQDMRLCLAKYTAITTETALAIAVVLSYLSAKPSIDCFQQCVERRQRWHIHAKVLRPLHGIAKDHIYLESTSFFGVDIHRAVYTRKAHDPFQEDRYQLFFKGNTTSLPNANNLQHETFGHIYRFRL